MAAPKKKPRPVPQSTPRYPRNIKTRMTFLAFGLLVLALVWLGLWIWVPANWWNLLLCGLFALAGAALLVEVRRPA
jgi:hypothetical protein